MKDVKDPKEILADEHFQKSGQRFNEHALFTITDRLTHFSPMSHFYTPWKRQKTIGFLTFSGGIEMGHWTKMG